MNASRWKLTGVVTLLLCAGANACPMCKDSLSNGNAQGLGALPNGFNTSIEIMLVGFLATFTLVGVIIWKGIRGSL